MHMRHTPAAALILALTACGGTSGTQYQSAHDVATAAGCAQIKAAPSGETTLFATDEVSCSHAGHFVIVDWFKDNASLANFHTASTGSGYVILYGPNWAISCVGAKDECSAIQKKLGGSLE